MNGCIPKPLVKLLAWVSLLIALAAYGFAQQTGGSVRGIVTDQVGSLVVNATVVAKDAKGAEKTTTTNSNGSYEFRSLPPGRYDLKVIVPGFSVLEEKNVEVKSGRTVTLDLQLSVGPLEQTVTIDNKGVSTDADRNADALVLRQRELAALPDDPEALAAALQALAGPSQGENGPQVR